MSNEIFASLLHEMAFLGELADENPFKIKAWLNSARIFAEESRGIRELVASGEIASIAGVGKGTQAMAREFAESGRLSEYEALRAKFPATIFELTEVPGLGPKKAKALYAKLHISSLSELEYACEENRLTELKGFGAKTQANILSNIQKLKANRGKAILPVALQQAEALREELQSLPGVTRAEETGELRRRAEVVRHLDFLLSGAANVEAALAGAGFRVDDAEPGVWQRTRDGELNARVWLAGFAEFGTRWIETTGPEAFVDKLRSAAPAPEEAEVFSAKSISFVPPECRERGHADAALVTEEDIRGVFHLHTNWSDGRHTLEEMVQGAIDLGLEYLGVSDHSQTAFYAHGLNGQRVREQKIEIARVQAKYPGFRIFHGTESDILADGSLDFTDDELKEFDFVIASVHGQMKMKKDEMTKRLVKVLSHPATTWLGHWTGRLLLGREGYDFDHGEVLAAAQAHGKSIELNSNPYRLDVDWRLASDVAARGIPIGIFPDAHSVGGLADVRYGVWMARKAGLRREQVINTKNAKEMEAWLLARKP